MADLSPLSAAADPTVLAGTLASASASALSLKMGATADGAGDARIDQTAQDFEAMFATQMLQPMFEGIDVDPTFGGGHGEQIMRSFLLQEYGKVIAKSDRLGIATQVRAEMLRMQESAHGSRRSAAQVGSAYRAASAASSGYGHDNAPEHKVENVTVR